MTTRKPSNNFPFVHYVCKAVAGLGAIALTCALLYAATTDSDDEVIHFIEPTANNTYIYDSATGKEYYLSDSAMAVREAEQRKAEEEIMKMYERKMEDIIRKREQKNFEK